MCSHFDLILLLFWCRSVSILLSLCPQAAKLANEGDDSSDSDEESSDTVSGEEDVREKVRCCRSALSLCSHSATHSALTSSHLISQPVETNTNGVEGSTPQIISTDVHVGDVVIENAAAWDALGVLSFILFRLFAFILFSFRSHSGPRCSPSTLILLLFCSRSPLLLPLCSHSGLSRYVATGSARGSRTPGQRRGRFVE